MHVEDISIVGGELSMRDAIPDSLKGTQGPPLSARDTWGVCFLWPLGTHKSSTCG